ncbi:M23 family metallopeptidase [Marmoricola sp. URHB0036]|uniref:M23 family metallopeptidase n=1 Tax=Marmoricola sp. URHB0036 TaxID=1298863 RepID=UPI0004212872|nr:M23 family metallopeptidase [Marmoricola sp. URHB0036]
MRLLSVLLATLFLASPSLAAPSAAETRPAPARDGVWPLSPRPQVVQGFDPPATRWGAGHRGVDVLGHVGQPVHSSLAGTVTFAAPLAGRGVVVVDHGGVRTTYEPVSASVAVGEVLARGAVLGTLQRASSHCLPRACLHWGLLRGDAYLNPLTLVGAGPIRLLPLSGSLPSGSTSTAFMAPVGPVNTRLVTGPRGAV